MSKTKKNTDVMVLGGAHSLMVSNVPDSVDVHTLSENFYRMSSSLSDNPRKSLETFGMWGGTLNINQFIPGVTPEMMSPKDKDFIEPMFRLLSSTVVAKGYNPTEFPEEVLKASLPLLVGQSVNLDHNTDVANAIGAVKSVEWQEAYMDDSGVIIPAGINGILKIDGLSNPRIARGILMDPPSIHSNSVTVEFEWEPSHTFEHYWEFYEKIGTYDESGELIRRIATRIISYKETSLVWHGADPFAQLIKSGRLNNPAYAGSQAVSLSEDQLKLVTDPKKRVSMYNFKSTSEVDLKYNTSNSINDTQEGLNNINNNKTSMNEELKAMLLSLFGEGLLQLAEGQEATTELAIQQIQTLREEASRKDAELKALMEENTSLKAEIEPYKQAKANWDNHVSSYREATIASYRKLMGDKAEDSILALLEKPETDLATLAALRNTYEDQLEQKFPLRCADCGSENVNRASSIPEPEEKVETQEVDLKERTTLDIAQDIYQSKLRK